MAGKFASLSGIQGLKELSSDVLGVGLCTFQVRLTNAGTPAASGTPFGLQLAQYSAAALDATRAKATKHGEKSSVVGISSIGIPHSLLQVGDLLLAAQGYDGSSWDVRQASAWGTSQVLHTLGEGGQPVVLTVLRPDPSARVKGVIASRVEDNRPQPGYLVKFAVGALYSVVIQGADGMKESAADAARLFDSYLLALFGLRYVQATNYYTYLSPLVRSAELRASALDAQGKRQEAVSVLENLPGELAAAGAVFPVKLPGNAPLTYGGVFFDRENKFLPSLVNTLQGAPFSAKVTLKSGPGVGVLPLPYSEAVLPEEIAAAMPGLDLVSDPLWRDTLQWTAVGQSSEGEDDGEGHAQGAQAGLPTTSAKQPARAALDACIVGSPGDDRPAAPAEWFVLGQPEQQCAPPADVPWRSAWQYPQPSALPSAFPPQLAAPPAGVPYGRAYYETGYSGYSVDNTLSGQGFPLGVLEGALGPMAAPAQAGPLLGAGASRAAEPRVLSTHLTRVVSHSAVQPPVSASAKKRRGRPAKKGTEGPPPLPQDHAAKTALVLQAEQASMYTPGKVAGILSSTLALPAGVSGRVRYSYGPQVGPVAWAKLQEAGKVGQPCEVQPGQRVNAAAHPYAVYLRAMDALGRKAVGEGLPTEAPKLPSGHTVVPVVVQSTREQIGMLEHMYKMLQSLKAGVRPSDEQLKPLFANLKPLPAVGGARGPRASSGGGGGGGRRSSAGASAQSKNPFWKPRGRKRARGRGGRRGARGRGDDDDDGDEDDEEFDVTQEEGGKVLARANHGAHERRKSGRATKSRVNLADIDGEEEEEEEGGDSSSDDEGEEDQPDEDGGEEEAAPAPKGKRKSTGGGGGGPGRKKGSSASDWAPDYSCAHGMVGGDSEDQLAKAPGENGVLAYKIDRIMAVRYADMPDPVWEALPPAKNEAEEDERLADFYRRQLAMRKALPADQRRAWDSCEYLIKWRGLSYQHAEWAAVSLLKEQGIWGPIRAKRFLETPEAFAQLEDEESRMAAGKEPPSADAFYDEDWGVLERILSIRPVWHEPAGDGRIEDKAAHAHALDKINREIASYEAGRDGKPAAHGPWEDESKPFGPKPSPEAKLRYVALIKWRGLAYADCTWEWLEEMNDDAAYQAYVTYNTVPEEALKSVEGLYAEVPGMRRPDGSPLLLDKRPTKSFVHAASPTYRDGRTLREYQLEGLNWMVHNWHGRRDCILADEMGLGKTIQSVALLDHLIKHCNVRGPFLVVVPLSTMGNWKRSFDEWTSLNVVYYHDAAGGADARAIIRKYEFDYPVANNPKASATAKAKHVYKFHVILTSYQVLLADWQYFGEIQWRYVIVDEAHALKNSASLLQQALQAMRRDALLLLTGTPLQNETAELWSLLNLVAPVKFPTLVEFSAKFGDLKSSDQVQALLTELGPILLRRVKEDVEKSIPPKEETVIAVELTRLQKAYYRAIFDKNRSFLARGASTAPVANLVSIEMELRKCCNHPYLLRNAEQREVSPHATKQEKCDQMVQASGKMVLLDKLLPKLRSEGHRVLIFSQFKGMLGLIEFLLQVRSMKYERIDGTVRGNERQAAIDRFNKPGSDIFAFLLSTKAGGQGINLTAADTVIIFDSDWNPQNDVQAMARAHRIGQTKDVRIYRLVTTKTYEAEMFKRSSMKLGLSQAVFEAGGAGAPARAAKAAKGEAAAALGEDGEGEVSGLLTMDRDKVEALLRFGAYAIMDEEEAAGAADAFQASTIEAILDRSVTMRYEGDGTAKAIGKGAPGSGVGAGAAAATSTGLSKASFMVDEADKNLDVKDPSFWDKVLGPRPANTLLKALTADMVVEKAYGPEDPTGARLAQWTADITALLDDVYEAKNENVDHEGLQPASVILEMLRTKGKGIMHPLSAEALARRPDDAKYPPLPTPSPEIQAMLGPNAITSAGKRSAYAQGKGERPESDEDGVQYDGDMSDYASWWLEKLDASRRQRKRARVTAVFADNEREAKKLAEAAKASRAAARGGAAGAPGARGRGGRGRGRPRGGSIAAQIAMGWAPSEGAEGDGAESGAEGGEASTPAEPGAAGEGEQLGGETAGAPGTAGAGAKRGRGFDPETGLDVGDVECDPIKGTPSVSNLRIRIAPYKPGNQVGARYAADVEANRHRLMQVAEHAERRRQAALAMAAEKRVAARAEATRQAQLQAQQIAAALAAGIPFPQAQQMAMASVAGDGTASGGLTVTGSSHVPGTSKLKFTLGKAPGTPASATPAAVDDEAEGAEEDSGTAIGEPMASPAPPPTAIPPSSTPFMAAPPAPAPFIAGPPPKEEAKRPFSLVLPASHVIRTGPRRAEILAAFSAGVPVSEWMLAVELGLTPPTRESSLAEAQASSDPAAALEIRERGILETARLAKWHMQNRPSKGDALRPLGLGEVERVPVEACPEVAQQAGLWQPIPEGAEEDKPVEDADGFPDTIVEMRRKLARPAPALIRVTVRPMRVLLSFSHESGFSIKPEIIKGPRIRAPAWAMRGAPVDAAEEGKAAERRAMTARKFQEAKAKKAAARAAGASDGRAGQDEGGEGDEGDAVYDAAGAEDEYGQQEGEGAEGEDDGGEQDGREN